MKLGPWETEAKASAVSNPGRDAKAKTRAKENKEGPMYSMVSYSMKTTKTMTLSICYMTLRHQALKYTTSLATAVASVKSANTDTALEKM